MYNIPINRTTVNHRICDELSKMSDIKYKSTEYEIRKTIFDYLCNTYTYDWDEYNKIFDTRINGMARCLKDEYKQAYDLLNYNKGLCHNFSHYYKLLLQKNGIYSLVAIIDDGTKINHAITMVYDKEHDCFSFDDIAGVIVKRGTSAELFDYDLEDAHNMNQMLKPVLFDNFATIMSSEETFFKFNFNSYDREMEFCNSFNIEKPFDQTEMPENIRSIKKLLKK